MTLEELYQAKAQCVKKLRAYNVYAADKGIRIPYQDKFATPEYADLIKAPMDELHRVMSEIFKIQLAMTGKDHFTKDNVWVWGGPTPSWGGSMAKDASIKAAQYFGFSNIMYVYGALNEEMMEIHKDCANVICHLGQNCRTAGAQVLSDIEEAEYLSELSLKYKNIRGGVIDDMTGNYGPKYNLKTYRGMHDAIKKHNPELELYAVVYTHELDMPQVRVISPCIDRVILWTWNVQDLTDIEMNVEKCRLVFPGKKIMMGVFMFDYGLTIMPNQPDAMIYQLTKAKKFLREGKIDDVVILGDREIEKCPAAAVAIKEFFAKEFAL